MTERRAAATTVATDLTRVTGRLASTALIACALSAQLPGPAAQTPAPADVRAAVEGTWQLEEWHVGGQVLKPPMVDGRWSNHDGAVLFMLHRTDTSESTMGYGIYQMDDKTWSYRYFRMQSTAGPMGGPVTVSIPKQAPEMRSFAIKREPGGAAGKIVLEAPGDRREYEGPYFTLIQKGQIVRKWRRVP